MPGSGRFDAVVGCGLGPLQLQALHGSAELFPGNNLNRHTAIAAKLLAAHALAETVILSGWTSNWRPPAADATALERREHATSEGELLAAVYRRARGRTITAAGHARALARVRVESLARTTGTNVLEALSLLDGTRDGYWQGRLGVLSGSFHLLRIAELLRAFGLADAVPLSAPAVLRRYGYRPDRLDPRLNGYARLAAEPASDVYADELRGYQNLQRSPAYVTFDLAKLVSDQRLHAIAWSLRRYYAARGVALPAPYATLPERFDPAWDYDRFRDECRSIGPRKEPLAGTAADVAAYQARASTFAAALPG